MHVRNGSPKQAAARASLPYTMSKSKIHLARPAALEHAPWSRTESGTLTVARNAREEQNTPAAKTAGGETPWFKREPRAAQGLQFGQGY